MHTAGPMFSIRIASLRSISWRSAHIAGLGWLPVHMAGRGFTLGALHSLETKPYPLLKKAPFIAVHLAARGLTLGARLQKVRIRRDEV